MVAEWKGQGEDALGFNRDDVRELLDLLEAEANDLPVDGTRIAAEACRLIKLYPHLALSLAAVAERHTRRAA